MKALRTVSCISTFIGVAGVLLAPAAMSAPGQGWDAFHTGQGEPLPAASKHYQGASLGASTGKGWDAFHIGQGEPIPPASKEPRGPSSASPNVESWSVFYTGEPTKR